MRKWRERDVDRRFRLVLCIGSKPIEIFGTIKEFVARLAEPRLSGQVS
jgi:hypothetical protein